MANAQFPEITLFSAIRQDAEILFLFLEALKRLSYPGKLSFWFYDDNDQDEAKHLLHSFCQESGAEILPSLGFPPQAFIKTEETHQWNTAIVDRVIAIKNFAIARFLNTTAEYLFLIDSDLILQPQTLEVLLETQSWIVSEVFWTQWRQSASHTPYLPNVWDLHEYSFSSPESILRLREPGLYRVGGLGACTLIHRQALEVGLNFSRITGVNFWGEDRHFCIRASCLGIGLYADTHIPPFHIYRKSLIPQCQEWLKMGSRSSFFRTWLDDAWETQIRSLCQTTQSRQ